MITMQAGCIFFLESWRIYNARWNAKWAPLAPPSSEFQVARGVMGKRRLPCFPQFGRARMEQATSSNHIPASEQTDEESLRQKRITNSKLYRDVAADMDPLVYSSGYNIGFMGLERLHPFDAGKWGHIRDFLVEEQVINGSSIVEPAEATKDDLLVVHPQEYLNSLRSSMTVAAIVEVPPVALLPNVIVQKRVLQPFRKQVGGTVLAGKLAKERGWAINLGGGFHHCCAREGGGFCVYADITLCIQFAFSRLSMSKSVSSRSDVILRSYAVMVDCTYRRVMIIDLDAHQGNGHERDFMNDDRVYILDMYNSQIYPFDEAAKPAINQKVELRSGTSTEDYLLRLEEELKIAKDAFQPDLIMYNAGTDILDGDPLGRLRVSPVGVQRRDESVFKFARELGVPIVMVTSGGYMKSSARVIADSIKNLVKKQLIGVNAVL